MLSASGLVVAALAGTPPRARVVTARTQNTSMDRFTADSFVRRTKSPAPERPPQTAARATGLARLPRVVRICAALPLRPPSAHRGHPAGQDHGGPDAESPSGPSATAPPSTAPTPVIAYVTPRPNAPSRRLRVTAWGGGSGYAGSPASTREQVRRRSTNTANGAPTSLTSPPASTCSASVVTWVPYIDTASAAQNRPYPGCRHRLMPRTRTARRSARHRGRLAAAREADPDRTAGRCRSPRRPATSESRSSPPSRTRSAPTHRLPGPCRSVVPRRSLHAAGAACGGAGSSRSAATTLPLPAWVRRGCRSPRVVL